MVDTPGDLESEPMKRSIQLHALCVYRPLTHTPNRSVCILNRAPNPLTSSRLAIRQSVIRWLE